MPVARPVTVDLNAAAKGLIQEAMRRGVEVENVSVIVVDLRGMSESLSG